MENRFNIPVPVYNRLTVRGDAEVKGQPPVGWWSKYVEVMCWQIRISAILEIRTGSRKGTN
jgi:hypothetical protein